jgi:hypothetical protein
MAYAVMPMELGHTTPTVMEAIASVLLALQITVLSPLKEVPLAGHVPVQAVQTLV